MQNGHNYDREGLQALRNQMRTDEGRKAVDEHLSTIDQMIDLYS